MKTYGTITFSTVDAPKPISGICENFSYRQGDQIVRVEGEDELAAIILHGAKGEIEFSSLPPGDVTALEVRAGAELTITGISGGKIICRRASARWQRGQPMVMEGAATHYPGVSATASGSITPGEITLARTAGPLQLPADTVWFGTEGISGPVAGIVQSFSIEEEVQIQEEENESGVITMLAVYGYEGRASIEMISAAAPPAIGSELDIFGGFRVTNSGYRRSKRQSRIVTAEGILIPGITG